MRRTSLALSAATVLAATLTGCGTSFGPEAGASMYSAAVASQSSKSAEQATSIPSAPTTAAASTEEPVPSTDPAPQTTSAAPQQTSLAATVEDALDQGGIGRPTWAAPIADVEELDASSVRLTYQESLPTEAAAVDLATKVNRFTTAEGAQLDTIVIRDTSGVDINVHCGQTICSTSLLETDR